MLVSPWRKSIRSASGGNNCVEARLVFPAWRKATRSGGNGGDCVEARLSPVWRKSSRSGGGGNNCVDARLSGVPQLSDSKLPDARPILDVEPDTFLGFLTAIKAGELDR
jgi:hypothetical protein